MLQAELEDLCFAVLQPAAYASVRSQLDALWGGPAQAQLRSPSAPQPPASQPQPPPRGQEPAGPPQLPLLAAAARQQVSRPLKAQAASSRKPLQLLPEDPAPAPSFLHACPTMYIDEAARPSRDGSASASTASATMSDDEAWAQVRGWVGALGSMLCCCSLPSAWHAISAGNAQSETSQMAGGCLSANHAP